MGLTQFGVAKLIKVSPGMASSYERGSEPTRPIYLRILDAFPALKESEFPGALFPDAENS